MARVPEAQRAEVRRQVEAKLRELKIREVRLRLGPGWLGWEVGRHTTRTLPRGPQPRLDILTMALPCLTH
jgi:hypothetical protein